MLGTIIALVVGWVLAIVFMCRDAFYWRPYVDELESELDSFGECDCCCDNDEVDEVDDEDDGEYCDDPNCKICDL